MFIHTCIYIMNKRDSKRPVGTTAQEMEENKSAIKAMDLHFHDDESSPLLSIPSPIEGPTRKKSESKQKYYARVNALVLEVLAWSNDHNVNLRSST